MLRIRTLSIGAAVLALGVAPALAADLTYEPAPAPSAPAQTGFSWTGPYIGANLGYTRGSTNTSGAGSIGDVNTSGIKGGLYGGYNLDVGNQIVVGAEVDGNIDGVDGSTSIGKAKQKWDSSVRARVGYAFDRYLAYGTAGAAISGAKVEGLTGSDSKTHLGWTAGAGVEGQLTNNVTARLEYRYADYGKKSYDLGGTPTDVDFNTNTIQAGVGMKF